MTVSASDNRTETAGNGSTTGFTYSYYFQNQADLKVYVRVESTGVETLQVLDTDYTITGTTTNGVYLNGATITMTTAPASGETLVIYDDPAVTQTTDLVENDPLPAETVEQTLDRAILIARRHKDQIDRSVQLSPAYDDTFDPTLPSLLVADTVIVVNSALTGFDTGPTTTEISNAQTYATNASASATAAAASATAAETAALAAAGPWNDVVYITNADSPYTVTSSLRGKMISVDTSSGAVSITLPTISALDLTAAFPLGVKKSTVDGNDVTISRAGTDTIDGATSKIIAGYNQGTVLIPDTDGSPDDWTTSDFGNSVFGLYDAVVGTATQVLEGKATHSVLATAISAISSGGSIFLLDGTFTENITLTKKIYLEGKGNGSVLSGTLQFSTSSDYCTIKNIKVTGNITIDSDVSGVFLTEIFTTSSNTITDSGTGNWVFGIEE